MAKKAKKAATKAAKKSATKAKKSAKKAAKRLFKKPGPSLGPIWKAIEEFENKVSRISNPPQAFVEAVHQLGIAKTYMPPCVPRTGPRTFTPQTG